MPINKAVPNVHNTLKKIAVIKSLWARDFLLEDINNNRKAILIKQTRNRM